MSGKWCVCEGIKRDLMAHHGHPGFPGLKLRSEEQGLFNGSDSSPSFFCSPSTCVCVRVCASMLQVCVWQELQAVRAEISSLEEQKRGISQTVKALVVSARLSLFESRRNPADLCLSSQTNNEKTSLASVGSRLWFKGPGGGASYLLSGSAPSHAAS